MSNIDNLGDYGNIWKDLAKYDGDKNALFKAIGDNKVAQETPGIVGKTLAIAIPVSIAIGAAVVKGVDMYKEKRKAKKKEAELKDQFDKEIEKVTN